MCTTPTFWRTGKTGLYFADGRRKKFSVYRSSFRFVYTIKDVSKVQPKNRNIRPFFLGLEKWEENFCPSLAGLALVVVQWVRRKILYAWIISPAIKLNERSTRMKRERSDVAIFFFLFSAFKYRNFMHEIFYFLDFFTCKSVFSYKSFINLLILETVN